MADHSRISRRVFVSASAAAAAGLTARDVPARADSPRQGGRSPQQVLDKLIEGNERFWKGKATQPRQKPQDFKELAQGQAPEAVIVGCADSRVPPEILFDEGIGDLFVVRVAGNVVDGAGPILKGSIEYAVAELGARLVVVLGHSGCGAVKAAIKHIDDKDRLDGSIGHLVDALKPAVADVRQKPGDLLTNAIAANVRRGVDRLKRLGPIVSDLVAKKSIQVAGAIYDLQTGKVTLVDDA